MIKTKIATKNAVLVAPNGLLRIQASDNRWDFTEIELTCASLENLCELATAERISHLWIMPQCGDYAIDYDRLKWDLKYTTTKDGLLKSAFGYRTGGGAWAFNLIVIRNTRWYGTPTKPSWMARATPQQLLVTLAYLETALGMAVGGSPSTAGWKLIERFNSAHPDWIAPPGVDLDAMHFSGGASFNLIAQRAMTPDEARTNKIYKFDMNSAFPYGVSTNDSFIGAGSPVHVFHGQDIDEKKVGVWLCDVGSTTRNLPFPIIDTPQAEIWLSAPIIRILRHTGHSMAVREGYVFPERHLTLQAWAQFLWEKRMCFRLPGPEFRRADCCKFAEEAIKQILNATLGLTLYSGFEEQEKSEKRRPDINMVAVGRTFETVYHKILKIQQHHGITPVIAYMDALYYVVPNKAVGEAMTRTLLARADLLGGFKYEGSIELDNEASSILLNDQDISASMKLAYLNKRGWKK